MSSYDAIVVGAGPAGSVTALRLAREGASVLLLDRAKFPRDKPCGGGLTYRAIRELPVDVTPVVEDVVDRFEFSFRYKLRFERRSAATIILMTQRKRLDRFPGRAGGRRRRRVPRRREGHRRRRRRHRHGRGRDASSRRRGRGGRGQRRDDALARARAGLPLRRRSGRQRPVRANEQGSLPRPRRPRARRRSGRLRLGLRQGRPRQRRRRRLGLRRPAPTHAPRAVCAPRTGSRRARSSLCAATAFRSDAARTRSAKAASSLSAMPPASSIRSPVTGCTKRS